MPWLSGRSLLATTTATKTRPDFVVAQYHSNMGNTGSFMLRQGKWKLITFGKNGGNFNGSCGAPCTYASQLFDVENDPEELKDVASTNPDVVAAMDKTLRGVVPYDDVDLMIKVEDHQIYQKYFVAKYASTKKLRNAWAKSYDGAKKNGNVEPLSDAEWAKIVRWAAEGEELTKQWHGE